VRHKAQYNQVYKPRWRISIHWTFKRKTHYLDFGDVCPIKFPGEATI
jgi:hypothetical protein